MNNVLLVGRLVKDPEITTTETGKQVTVLNLAVHRSYKNADGLYETDFIRCRLWNGVAVNTCEYCHSGDVVGVKGRLENSNYEDAEGNKKYLTEVVVERVTFLTPNKEVTEDNN